MRESYSVVVPAYNAAETIEEALNSILSQSFPPERIIVVDDGSSDDTARCVETLEAPRVSLIRQANRGPGAATNAGLAEVVTPFVGFLDADDLWLPHKAECQLAFLTERPHLSAVIAQVQVFKGPSERPELGPVADGWSRTTLMMRTDDARKIGPMIDLPGGRGDTIDWMARGREQGYAFELMREVLSMRRIRPGSLSYGRDAEKDRGYLLTVKRALERKRAATAHRPSPARDDD